MVTEVMHNVSFGTGIIWAGWATGWSGSLTGVGHSTPYLILRVTIANTTQSMVTIQNRVTILAS